MYLKYVYVHTWGCKGKGLEGCTKLITYEEEIGNEFT